MAPAAAAAPAAEDRRRGGGGEADPQQRQQLRVAGSYADAHALSGCGAFSETTKTTNTYTF